MNEASKSKTLWGSLKNLVVEEVPDASQPTPPLPQVATAQPPPAVELPLPRAEVDQVAKRKLEESIANAAPPGYSEIVDTIATLSDSIPEEGARFRAALKLASKRGHSVDDVLGDIDKCLGILEAKGREFEDETKAQIERKVGARQKAIAGFNEAIKLKTEQMTTLQKEIADLSEKRGTETATIATETARITTVQQNFGAAYDSVHEQLSETRKKIVAYGKSVGS